MTLVYHILSLLGTAAYYVTQFVLPKTLLTWIAGKMPTWPDVFAPRGWFEPKPQAFAPYEPLEAPWPLGWMGVNGLSKLIVHRSVRVSGIVWAVEPPPLPGTWDHDTFYIKAAPTDHTFAACLNAFNALMDQSYPNTANCLKVYTPLTYVMPKVGEAITTTGAQVIDLANGWVGLVEG